MSKPGFYDEDSTQFKEELEQSEKYRQQIGRMLMENGLRVEVPPMEYRENLADRARFANEKDIIVWCGVSEQEMAVIEVKSRNEKFTSAKDFGRLLRTKCNETAIFVDTKYGWDKKSPKPKLVLMVSRPTGAIIALPGKTQGDWGTKTCGDGSRGISRETFYTAEPELFIPLETAVKKLFRMQVKCSPKVNEYGRVKLAAKRSEKLLVNVEEIVLSDADEETRLEAIENLLTNRPRLA